MNTQPSTPISSAPPPISTSKTLISKEKRPKTLSTSTSTSSSTTPTSTGSTTASSTSSASLTSPTPPTSSASSSSSSLNHHKHSHLQDDLDEAALAPPLLPPPSNQLKKPSISSSAVVASPRRTRRAGGAAGEQVIKTQTVSQLGVFGERSSDGYQLSEEMKNREIEVMCRRYGGFLKAHRAATVIQARYRQYKMAKNFNRLCENTLAKRRSLNNAAIIFELV